ncbi:MAG: DUF2493 domain-containing protein [Deltaproteobacteria bacterium]|nr:MAG: DUF2493 domain-containing protein [Deltaproteobacteria bacterium]
MAERWALERGIETLCYRAEWEKHGRAGGPIRNRQMLEEASRARAPTLCWRSPAGAVPPTWCAGRTLPASRC